MASNSDLEPSSPSTSKTLSQKFEIKVVELVLDNPQIHACILSLSPSLPPSLPPSLLSITFYEAATDAS